MEQEKTYTETELRNEVKKLVKTDLTGTKVVIYMLLPIFVLFVLLFVVKGSSKINSFIVVVSFLVYFIAIVLLWQRNLKSIFVDNDSFADLAQKLKKVKHWNRFYACSLPSGCLAAPIFKDILDILEKESVTWDWVSVVVVLVVAVLVFLCWKFVGGSMKQKYDGLIANLEEGK